MAEDTKMRDAVILSVVALLSGSAGGSISFLKPSVNTESIELRLSIVESKVDIIWEMEKNRIARELGETK